jgi:hypothetical protein
VDSLPRGCGPLGNETAKRTPLRCTTEEVLMALKDVLQQFLDDEQWEDQIAHDHSDNTDFINTGFVIDGQRYRLILITADVPQTIRVVLISPLKVPKARSREAAIVLNALNVHMAYGNFELDDEGILSFRWGMDLEFAKAVPQQFGHLINAGTSAFNELRAAVIGAAAFSKQPAETIILEYKKAIARPEEVREAIVH